MKIKSYIRVGSKDQLIDWEKELKIYWTKKVGAWRKC